MKHRDIDESRHPRGADEGLPGGRHHRHGHHHRHRPGGHGRQFDYGELRLLLLAMIAERPRHGYELIKALEERFGGSYSPSPGVMYPTLAWLVDMGYAAPEAEDNARKRYRSTEEGQAFLLANRATADELLSRPRRTALPEAEELPPAMVRAMENLRFAIRLRLGRGPIDRATADSVASALDAVAQTVERSEPLPDGDARHGSDPRHGHG